MSDNIRIKSEDGSYIKSEDDVTTTYILSEYQIVPYTPKNLINVQIAKSGDGQPFNVEIEAS
jgi:hypothetical protein